jgi:nucleoside-diphosphate-sugar epimerase
MTRVLVTGATGFIGKHTVRQLIARDVEVIGVGKRQPELWGGSSFHAVDLLDPDATASVMSRSNPTHLLHLAWYAEPGKFWTARENLAWITATDNLVRAFIDRGGRRVVVAGTCAEYDWRYGFCSEDLTPLTPETHYGIAKVATCKIIEKLCTAKGVGLVWARLFFPYGPGEHPSRFVSSIASALQSQSGAVCQNGALIRDYVYIDDVAAALAALVLENGSTVVNLGSGVPVKLGDLAYQIASLLGMTSRLQILEPLHDQPPVVLADARRLKRIIPSLKLTTMTEALARMFHSYRK